MLKALFNPFGIVLLLVSLALTVLVSSVLDRWSGQAIWIALIGLIAYAASTAVTYLLPSVVDPARFYDPTQIALRRINRLPNLSRCDLITLLPRTLSANHLELETGQHSQTPLEKAQVLREVLIAAIEKLRPPAETAGAGADPALGYHILHEFYLEDKPVAYLLSRYHIADATYHRHRRDAIRAISKDIEAHEALLGSWVRKLNRTLKRFSARTTSYFFRTTI